MTDTFDAVLAEMRERASRMLYVGPHKIIAALDRLAAAHAAELAERDARVHHRESIIAGHADDTREYQKLIRQAEARAEAAERDARRLDWLLRNGKEIVFFVGGDLYCYTHMDDDERALCRAAIDTAIATTEQAAGGLVLGE